MKIEEIEMAYILSDIINETKIDENGFITTKNIFTANDLKVLKSFIIKIQNEIMVKSNYFNEAIQKTNNILQLWPYKDE